MTIEIDHTSLSVADFEAAKRFYAAALKPLRVEVMMEFPADVTGSVDVAGLGSDGKPFLWLANAGRTLPRVHLAFRAETREQVDAFYAAALAAGATDNGPPGIRPHYHANYYGAFVLDAEGHNVEVVCHVDPAAKAVERAPANRAAPRKRAAAGKKRGPAKRAAARKPASRKRTAAKKPATRKRSAASKKPAPSRKRPAGRKARARRRPAVRKPTRRR
jgi:catechol 2,3-dioxygenase-like lactoylglutathione lyase family enzyme